MHGRPCAKLYPTFADQPRLHGDRQRAPLSRGSRRCSTTRAARARASCRSVRRTSARAEQPHASSSPTLVVGVTDDDGDHARGDLRAAAAGRNLRDARTTRSRRINARPHPLAFYYFGADRRRIANACCARRSPVASRSTTRCGISRTRTCRSAAWARRGRAVPRRARIPHVLEGETRVRAAALCADALALPALRPRVRTVLALLKRRNG